MLYFGMKVEFDKVFVALLFPDGDLGIREIRQNFAGAIPQGEFCDIFSEFKEEIESGEVLMSIEENNHDLIESLGHSVMLCGWLSDLRISTIRFTAERWESVMMTNKCSVETARALWPRSEMMRELPEGCVLLSVCKAALIAEAGRRIACRG